MNVQAVLFDCDGVLVDSEPAGFQLLVEDLTARGVATQPQDLMRFMGGTLGLVWQTLRAEGVDLPDDWVARFYDRLYDRLAQGTALLPGVAPMLRRLSAAGLRLAVGSNGSRRKMEVTLGQHPEVYALLTPHLYSAPEIGTPKPAPDVYLHAAAALGVAPEACVVVEDSAPGARAARLAGMRCYGYGTHGGAALLAEGALPLRHFDDLPALLGL